MNSPKPLNKLLFGSSKEIKSLLDRASYLNELTCYLRTILPETVAPHCQIANIKMNRSGINLVLITDSPVWSTKIRFYIPAILSHMKKHKELQQLNSIRIKTRPREYHNTEEEQIRVVQMSDKSAQLIAQAANSTQDETLKAALKRLSNRGANNSGKH
ncbi:MAG TPA: DUF721 domain-containing protein [Gammaproteobacteria bacterium]|nr:DUF721 domain-containing protein [Gammaproteobacteria bacterium]